MRTISLSLKNAADELLRRPTLRVLVDFDRDGEYETDITSDVESISDNHELQSGGGLKRGKPSVDQATLVLFNECGYYSPRNANSPYSGNVVPGVGIRILAGFDDENVAVFTGVVSAWNVSRKDGKCTVKCKDKAFYMQRKDSETALLINIALKDAIERLVNWTFGEGNQAMEIDAVPLIIPALELDKGTKVWAYIQQLAEACDARAYFDGDGVFHFHSKLALGFEEDTEPMYHFTADRLFTLDEEFDETPVVNKWTVTSEYLFPHPTDIVWGTPEEEVEVTEEYVAGDPIKNAVDFSSPWVTIQLKTKPEGSTEYENTWNVPLVTKHEGAWWDQTVACKVRNVTKDEDISIYWRIHDSYGNPDWSWWNDIVHHGLIHLSNEHSPIEAGDLLQVTYRYRARVIEPNRQRTWYAELAHKSHDVQPLEFAANSGGVAVTCSTEPDTPNSLCVQDYTMLSAQKMRITLKNNTADAVFISTMQVKASPVLASSPLSATSINQESVNYFGLHEEEIKNDYIISEDYIQKLAAYLCDRYSQPRSIVKAEVKGLPQIELGDRVRVTEDVTGLDFDFIVTAIDDSWSSEGWMASLTLEEADAATWQYQDGRATIVNRAGGRAATTYSISGSKPQNVQPKEIVAFAGGKARFTLTWEAVADPALDYYRIYCLFPDAEEYQPLGRTASTETTFIHDNLTFGETYGYKVSSVNKNGIESPLSVPLVTVIGDNKRPATPANQKATGGANSITLEWNEVVTNYDGTQANDISIYRIYRLVDAAYVKLIDVPAPTTKFVHGGLGNKVTESYKITCIDINGNESDMPSTAITATTTFSSTEDSTPPNPPTNLSVYAMFRAFTLTWNAPASGPPIDHYIVEYITSADGQVTWDPSGWMVHSGRVGSTYFVHTGLNPELDYKYRVKSVSVAGVTSATYSSEKIAGRPDKVDLGSQVDGTMTLTDSIVISSGRMLIDQNGLRATNQLNEETISIDSTTGNARFAGIVQAKELLIPVRSV